MAGSPTGLACLRQALAARCRWFVSHLPVEGEGCIEVLAGSRRSGVWLSPWAVSHAAHVRQRVAGACFVVVEDTEGRVGEVCPCECLRLSVQELRADPAGQVERLLAFVAGAPATASICGPLE